MIVYVDFTEPEINVDYPDNKSTINKDYVQVRGSVVDDLSGIFGGKIQARLDGGKWIDVPLKGDTFKFTFAQLKGEHIIYIRAIDRAGNIATISIKVVMSPPTQEIPIMKSIILVLVAAIVTVIALLFVRKIIG